MGITKVRWASMPVTIQASAAGWGDALPQDVEAVARSVADSLLLTFQDSVECMILVVPVADASDNPRAIRLKSDPPVFAVELNAPNRSWARLAFQFSHELCHVLADPGTWRLNRYHWLEEVLCETAALCTLRNMALRWATDPPYSNWMAYAPSLSSYAEDRIRTITPLVQGQPFPRWLAERMPSLECNPYLRQDNLRIAVELLPLFEHAPASWEAMGCLHTAMEQAETLPALFTAWEGACSHAHRDTIQLVALTLGAT